MKPIVKLIVITVPVVVAGALVLANIMANKAPPARVELSERATAVRVIEVQEMAVRPRLSGFGLVAPSRTYEAISQVGGTADYVNPALRKGEIIPEGAVLLRLSPEDFNLAIAQARANIRAAEAKLAELAISEQNQQAALVIEEDALALKATDLERSESLFASQAISQTVLDNTRSAHLGQSQKVLGIRSGLALLPTQRAAQSEQIAVYRASLASAELNLARSELRLPFTARVSLATVEEGQFVKAGQTIASFDGIEAADVEAQVSVADLSRLLGEARAQAGLLAFDPESMSSVLKSLGIEATVRLQLGNDVAEWPATLDRISNVIDPKSGTLGVIVRVENAYGTASQTPHPPLTKGLFVEVELVAPATAGMVIPRAALDQGRVLLADEDGRLVVHPVQPALVQGEIVLIKEGLAAGSQVVVSTPRPVIPGMLLELTLDESLMQRLAEAAQ
ncbi:MAG TPA: hypothetical protein EYG79_03925 [Rhodobacteraceae bacterium]|nr:hypothetical protein [Paracoccaceae bacterium]